MSLLQETIGRELNIPAISYKRSPIIENDRVQKIIDTFGYMGSDAPYRTQIRVSSEFSFKIGQINVISGPSGSGKTSILKSIKKQLKCDDGQADLPKLPNDEQDDYIINLVGKNIKESICLLTSVGLGEGNLFLRQSSQLSDGQKFRMRLALRLDNNQLPIICIDEFGSKLDITTAKSLAITLSKFVRKHNFILFVCCNNEEVADIFQPDTIIKLGYDYDVDVLYHQIHKNNLENIIVSKGSLSDYNKFRKYHYLDVDGRTENAEILIALQGQKQVGIQLLVPPLSQRRVNLHPYFAMINEKMITIHRIVVHPEYRARGVGSFLCDQGQKILEKKIIEIRSTLFSFIPIPLQWGFQEYENSYFDARPEYNAVEKFVADHGYDPRKLIFREYNLNLLKHIDCEKLACLLKRDEDEKHIAQLFYYCDLMEKAGYGYEGDRTILANLLVSIDTVPKSEEEILSVLLKHTQVYYRSFYKINK